MKYIYLAITILFLASCEDVIDLPLEEGPKLLVIDANINWKKGEDGKNQKIKLTETVGYYDTAIPAASGATVKITNGSTIIPFQEIGTTGVYETTDFNAQLNETYTLTIDYNGETFSAEEKLIPTPTIDSITQSIEDVFGSELLRVEFFFDDPAKEEENYYISQFHYTEEYLIDSYSTQSDALFDNEKANRVVELDDTLVPGDVLTLYLYGSSKTYFNYFNLLLDQLSSGGPFSTPPSSVIGNCINTTNPTKKPLGYFRLSEMEKVEYTIKEFE